MVRQLFLALQVAMLALALYHLVTAAWGWRAPTRAAGATSRRRFLVIVPAHDEAGVIRNVLADLRGQAYPADLVDVVVVADRCTDATADVARQVAPWAEVRERSDGPDGKGAALAWAIDHAVLDPDDAVLVVDADNRLPIDLLDRFAAELDGGAQALQAYLDVTNPDGSLLATASALTYWAGNRMVQHARSVLGWSADLGGTGMCLTSELLDRAGGFTSSLTEDQHLGVRVVLAGGRVRWVHDVRVRDEKPTGIGVAVRQRARWAAGRRGVARESLGPLARAAFAQRSWAPIDVALRLVQPGRSFVAAVTGAAALAATLSGSAWLLPAVIWWVATAAQLLLPLAFLARDGVGGRYLLRYPLVTLVAALWLPVQVVSALAGRSWYHTPHRGDPDAGVDADAAGGSS